MLNQGQIYSETWFKLQSFSFQKGYLKNSFPWEIKWSKKIGNYSDLIFVAKGPL